MWYLVVFGGTEDVFFRFKEKSDDHAIRRSMTLRDKRYPKMDLIEIRRFRERWECENPDNFGSLVWDWINGAV